MPRTLSTHRHRELAVPLRPIPTTSTGSIDAVTWLRQLWKWLSSGPDPDPKPDTYRVGDDDQPPAYRSDGVATGTSPGSIGGSDIL